MFNGEIVNIYDFKESHKTIINNLTPRSEGLVMFGSIRGYYHITAIEAWSDILLDRGLTVMRYAQGLATMRQDDHVTSSHIAKAFEIQARGIDQDILSLHLPYVPRPVALPDGQPTNIPWDNAS